MTETSDDRGQQGAQAPVPAVTCESLAKSVRRVKIWLSVLTAALALSILGSCAFAGYAMLGTGVIPYSVEMSVPDEQLDATTQEFEDGFGSDIESLDVRAVAIEYGDMGFPYSIMGGSGEETVYVECRLKSTDVVIAGLVGYMYGLDASSSGMIPTKGTLASRMTPEQLATLLKAYAAETDSPLGSVRRYGDRDEMMYEGTTVGDTVTVGSAEYPTNELWAATEGTLIEGDSIDMSMDPSMNTEAYIFHEDPETGEFVFVGTEPGTSMW